MRNKKRYGSFRPYLFFVGILSIYMRGEESRCDSSKERERAVVHHGQLPVPFLLLTAPGSLGAAAYRPAASGFSAALRQ